MSILVFWMACPYFREPEVRFPVEPEKHVPQHTIDVMKKIQEKKAKIEAITEEIVKEAEAHAKAMHKFRKRKEELDKFIALVKASIVGITEKNR